MKLANLLIKTMSEEQLSSLLAELKEDAGLLEKLKGAGDLDAAVVTAKDAAFDVSKADWIRYQAKQSLELSDAELERVAGGEEKRAKLWHYVVTLRDKKYVFKEIVYPRQSLQSQWPLFLQRPLISP